MKAPNKLRFVLLSVALLSLFHMDPCLAQSNGKISGQVTDAVTGEGLPGVSVFLEENPNLGTATDINGRYFLLSVPPGTYTLVMSYVGFASLKSQNAKVFSGRTTTIDGKLSEEVIEGQEVIVSAERQL